VHFVPLLFNGFLGGRVTHRIRPIAICVFRQADKILVCEGYDPVRKQTFYRPLGGTIEFGERGEQTVRRELMEQLGAEVADVRYLGLLESLFTFNDQPYHEIVMVYHGRLIDSALYDQAELAGHERGEKEPFKAVWKRLADFTSEATPLYPNGLLELLA
jgi:8-oxo-dGTP pyrophosphatase MutT (NUDIX family)